MKAKIATVLLAAAAGMSFDTLSDESRSLSSNSQIDAHVKVLSEARARVFGKATEFCAEQHQPQSLSIDDALKSYLAAFSEGTTAGLVDIANKDMNHLASAPVFGDKEFEMMDRQAELMLMSVQTSPVVACEKLASVLESGTSESFKEETLQSYSQYKERRAEYCARIPMPEACE